MNSIVCGKIRGRISEVFCLLGRYLVQKRKMIYCDNIMMKLLCTVIGFGIILSSVKLERRFSIVEIASE